MTNFDKSTSGQEETTPEEFITSTITNEITESTKLSQTSTGSTKIFQTYSASLPVSDSSTFEYVTTTEGPTSISEEARICESQ